VAERTRPQAALLDRDGTIIEDRHYLHDPADVVLLPGAAAAIRRLSDAGIPSIVITNQSGIARGIFPVESYRIVRQRVLELLAAEGALLLDTFACPHHADFGLPCDCRKPELGLYRRAAAAHGLDLSRCLFVGDRIRDVLPALALGGASTLVPSHNTPAQDVIRAASLGVPRAASLCDVVDALLAPNS
jgi:D-glycero-D-manno-heptose 1,7-bisphosphate phosphatase